MLTEDSNETFGGVGERDGLDSGGGGDVFEGLISGRTSTERVGKSMGKEEEDGESRSKGERKRKVRRDRHQLVGTEREVR